MTPRYLLHVTPGEQMNITSQTTEKPLPSDLLPPMTYQDFTNALGLVASGKKHKTMVPFLVSALRQQAPFMTGEMLMFEILCSASCLADLPSRPLDA